MESKPAEEAEEAPPEPLTIPAQPLAGDTALALGAIVPSTGTGTGSGEGQGSGLGLRTGGGVGGGVYRPGSGLTVPQFLREVKPNYTADAMRAKVQGVVVMECVVLPDGSVGDVRVIKSLDKIFGLDEEAIKAAKQWRFSPGRRLGEPVPVYVTIELTFVLR